MNDMITMSRSAFCHAVGSVGDVPTSRDVRCKRAYQEKTSLYEQARWSEPPPTKARPQGDPAIWASTVVAQGAIGNGYVGPGSYLAIPFGYFGADGRWPGLGLFGVSGDAFGKPMPIEIRSDGSVLPKIIKFSPFPRPQPPSERN